MAIVTLRVLEGLERGRVYSPLSTPVSIGREDDNDLQLNDDRVSRFHAKLQDDGGRVILTDLDSTNGTRVNGHPVQVKVLQPGDLIAIGRCVLLFGDPPGWTKDGLRGEEQVPGQTAYLEGAIDPSAEDLDFLSPPQGLTDSEILFPHGAPQPPDDLRPLHRAQVSDMLAYLHDQIGVVLAEATEVASLSQSERAMVCPRLTWDRLIAAQTTLAGYLRKIADPAEPTSGE